MELRLSTKRHIKNTYRIHEGTYRLLLFEPENIKIGDPSYEGIIKNKIKEKKRKEKKRR
jgi:hypothetical protein